MGTCAVLKRPASRCAGYDDLVDPRHGRRPWEDAGCFRPPGQHLGTGVHLIELMAPSTRRVPLAPPVFEIVFAYRITGGASGTHGLPLPHNRATCRATLIVGWCRQAHRLRTFRPLESMGRRFALAHPTTAGVSLYSQR